MEQITIIETDEMPKFIHRRCNVICQVEKHYKLSDNSKKFYLLHLNGLLMIYIGIVCSYLQEIIN